MSECFAYTFFRVARVYLERPEECVRPPGTGVAGGLCFATWIPEINLWSPTRAASALSHLAISQGPSVLPLKVSFLENEIGRINWQHYFFLHVKKEMFKSMHSHNLKHCEPCLCFGECSTEHTIKRLLSWISFFLFFFLFPILLSESCVRWTLVMRTEGELRHVSLFIWPYRKQRLRKCKE